MGQQQLLLLVLATVIVGLATVAGIQAFDQGQTRANQDALTNTAVKIASDIQAKTEEPSQFGGYDGNLTSGSPTAKGSITLEEIGYDTDGSNDYVTSDGKCGLVAGGGNSGSVSATQVDDPDGAIDVLCESENNEVRVGVNGLDSGNINTETATDQDTDLTGSGGGGA